MSKYHLPPEQLAKIDHTYTTGYGDYTELHTQHGLTQQEWDDLPEWQQRQYFYEYSADPGKPGDPANRLPRGKEPDRQWGQQADKGYDVDPAELRQLAKDMQYKLDIWQTKLNRVGATSITTADLGNTKGAGDFVDVANQSKTGFQEYITAIVTSYKGVIRKLQATADSYENAHHKIQGQVNGVNPTAAGNPNLK